MDDYSLVYPMFAMVVLTVVVLLILFRARVKSVAEGKIRASYYKTYQGETEPETTLRLSRHFVNIFEAPTLFYIACLAAMVTGQSSMALDLLAWAYVLLRFAHAFIHIGNNKLRPRIAVYFSSWFVLFAMWIFITIGISTVS